MAMTGNVRRLVIHAVSPGSRRDIRQRVEISGKRLAHAPGIVDAHRHASQRSKGKAHGHAVIVVGVYGGAGRNAVDRRRDAQEIRTLVDCRANSI